MLKHLDQTLQKTSDQGLQCLPLIQHQLVVNWTCSKFWTRTISSLCVPIFRVNVVVNRVFMVTVQLPCPGSREDGIYFYLAKGRLSYDSQRTKRALMQFAGNAGPDQPAHSRRLIRAFVARLQNQWIL